MRQLALLVTLLPAAAQASFTVLESPPKMAQALAAPVPKAPPPPQAQSAVPAPAAGLGLIAVSFTGTPSSDVEIRNGFGRDVRLSEALKQIVPSGRGVFLSDSVSAAAGKLSVSWRGGRRWVEVLDILAADQGLLIDVVWDKRQIYVEDKSSLAVKSPPKTMWVAQSPSTLHEAVQAWAKQVGWELRWLPDDLDYAILGRLSYEGSFENAITGIFRVYEGAERPLLVNGNPDQRVLIVSEKRK